jgi:hypothetical protein
LKLRRQYPQDFYFPTAQVYRRNFCSPELKLNVEGVKEISAEDERVDRVDPPRRDQDRLALPNSQPGVDVNESFPFWPKNFSDIFFLPILDKVLIYVRLSDNYWQ